MKKRNKLIILITVATIILGIALTIVILNNDKNPHNDINKDMPVLKPRIPSSNNPIIEDILTINSEILVTANQDTAFAIIDTLERGRIAGHFYPIAYHTTTAERHEFEITLRRGSTSIILDSTEIELDIPARKLEDYLDGKKHNASYNNKQRRVAISVKPYYTPTFHATNDERYRKRLYNVKVKRDIHYGTAQGFWTTLIDLNDGNYGDILKDSFKKIRKLKDLDLTLDLYLPDDSLNTPHPFLLFIHGGAFYIGNKLDTTTTIFCRHFASMGYITASIDYRMGFLPSKKEIDRTEYMALQDAHAAMRYLLATDSLHLINPDQLFVGGSSAGAMIALNLAYMTNRDRPEISAGKKRKQRFPDLGDIESSGNNYTTVFSFRGIANLWGAMNSLELMKGSKTEIISFHGDKDKLVPYTYGYPFSNIGDRLGKRLIGAVYGSAAIHKRAEQYGIRSQLVTLEGLGHAPQFDEDHNIIPNRMNLLLDSTTHFFYRSLVPIIPNIKPAINQQRQYTLNGGEFKNVEWKVEGGFFLDINDQSATVIWFADSPTHKISATLTHPSGLDFTIDYSPDSSTKKTTEPQTDILPLS